MKDKLLKFWNDHPREILTVAYIGTVASLTAYSVYKVVSGKDVVGAHRWEAENGEYSEIIVRLRNGYSVTFPKKGQ